MDFQDRSRDLIGKGKTQNIFLCTYWSIRASSQDTHTDEIDFWVPKRPPRKDENPTSAFPENSPHLSVSLLVSYAILFFWTHYRNRAQIRRFILVNHMYALFILPQPWDTMPDIKKKLSCIFQRRNEWKDCVLYMPCNEETTSLTCSAFLAPYWVYVTKPLWQNLFFCKEQASPKSLWNSPGSFIIIFFEHSSTIWIYNWPCSNIAFLFIWGHAPGNIESQKRLTSFS